MEFREDVKRFAPIVIIAVLSILAFFLVKPFLIPIIGGLILAYAFSPLYKLVNKYVKIKSLSAGLMLLILLVIIAIPMWIIAPIVINQAFGLFQSAQTLDFSAVATKLFPTASKDFVAQMAVTMDSLLSKASSVVLNTLANLFLNVILIGVSIIIAGFVFFYALKDSDKMEKIILKLSPLSKSKEKIVVRQFKDITGAIVYGQIAIGLVQGLLAGLGLFIFNVPNALVLTIASIFLSIIPIIGPGPIWIPVGLYMFLKGDVGMGIAFLAYNIFIVSTIDNIIRTYFVSKKMKMSPVLVLLGMIGGVFLFGIVGIIVGPLILAYLITFWESYKDSGEKSILISENHP